MAGALTTDDPPVPPQSPIPSEPWSNTVYSATRLFHQWMVSNTWPFITNPSDPDPGAAHPSLALSKQVLISKGHGSCWRSRTSKRKTMVGRIRTEYGENRMRTRRSQPAWDKTPRRVPSIYPIPGKAGHSPCLFDLRSDPGEHVDLSATFPETWLRCGKLNSSVLTQRIARDGLMRECPGLPSRALHLVAAVPFDQLLSQ